MVWPSCALYVRDGFSTSSWLRVVRSLPSRSPHKIQDPQTRAGKKVCGLDYIVFSNFEIQIMLYNDYQVMAQENS